MSIQPRFPSHTARLLSLLAGVFALAGTVTAQTARFGDTVTGWHYYFNQIQATVNSQDGLGRRLVNLERVGTTSNFDFVTVDKAGPYPATATTAVYDLTSAQLSSALGSSLRLLDLEVRIVNDSERFTAILVPNSGATAVNGWAWYFNQTRAQVQNYIAQNPQYRLIDIERYTKEGTTRYAFIAVHNSGAEARSHWGLLWEASTSTVNSTLQLNAPSILIDVEVESISLQGTRFTGIWTRAPEGANTTFHADLSQASLIERVSQSGGRIVGLRRYTNMVDNTVFAVSTIDNSNAETRRIRNLMDSRTNMDGNPAGGRRGFHIQRDTGQVIASLDADFAYEPASSLKIAHAAATFELVAAGLANLNEGEWRHASDSDACPFNTSYTGTTRYTLGQVVRRTMRESDNTQTNHLRVLLDDGGDIFSGVNAFLSDQGLVTAQQRHHIGCMGTPLAFGQLPFFNRFTAREAVNLYLRIGRGQVFSTSWRDELFFNHMRNWPQDRTGSEGTRLNTIIDTEAAAARVTAANRTAFKNALRFAWKAGGYGLTWNAPPQFPNLYDEHIWHSDSGWASLPLRDASGNIVRRNYGLAIYRHEAPREGDRMLIYGDFAELLRVPLREALETWSDRIFCNGFEGAGCGG